MSIEMYYKVVIFLVTYVITGLGLSKAIKQYGYWKPYLAWIPLVNYMVMTRLTEWGGGKTKVYKSEVDTYILSYWIWIDTIMYNIVSILGYRMLAGILFWIVFSVFMFINFEYIFRTIYRYTWSTSRKRYVYSIISAIFPVIGFLYVLILKPVEEVHMEESEIWK